MIRAIVTDIEGTTTALTFVHDVLFPYARAHLPAFVRQQVATTAVAAQLDAVRQHLGQVDADVESVIQTLLVWIAEDRKLAPLKTLQGLLWELGYQQGEYTGHVYADAADQLTAWAQRGIRLYVYSSGSVYAQKLLFSHSSHGDLTPLFQGYFDTQTGPKREADSYTAIAQAITMAAAEILFLSDQCAELEAASQAGMHTVLLARPENPATDCTIPRASDFHEVTALYGKDFA